MFAERSKLAAKDLGLPLETLQLAFAGVLLRRNGRVHIEHAGLRPNAAGLRFGCTACLLFEPCQAPVKQLEPALHGDRLLPRPLLVQGCEGGYALREASQVGDECSRELRKGETPRPALG